VLGSVGEPINPEAWMWYHEHIGGGGARRRHVVADRDGRDHDQPAARATTTKPARRRSRCPGSSAELVDDDGHGRTAAAATSR
jgi:acetyl-CoA synthetase